MSHLNLIPGNDFLPRVIRGESNKRKKPQGDFSPAAVSNSIINLPSKLSGNQSAKNVSVLRKPVMARHSGGTKPIRTRFRVGSGPYTVSRSGPKSIQRGNKSRYGNSAVKGGRRASSWTYV